MLYESVSNDPLPLSKKALLSIKLILINTNLPNLLKHWPKALKLDINFHTPLIIMSKM